VGATVGFLGYTFDDYISIHAPAWGRLSFNKKCVIIKKIPYCRVLLFS
jgi:hypothetical protein